MKLHGCTRGLLAGAISLMVLAGATGVAQADPDPTPPPVPDIDTSLPLPPQLFKNPANQRIPPKNWDGAGMYCENIQVTCG
jgi:hypothetical protein